MGGQSRVLRSSTTTIEVRIGRPALRSTPLVSGRPKTAGLLACPVGGQDTRRVPYLYPPGGDVSGSSKPLPRGETTFCRTAGILIFAGAGAVFTPGPAARRRRCHRAYRGLARPLIRHSTVSPGKVARQ